MIPNKLPRQYDYTTPTPTTTAVFADVSLHPYLEPYIIDDEAQSHQAQHSKDISKFEIILFISILLSVVVILLGTALVFWARGLVKESSRLKEGARSEARKRYLIQLRKKEEAERKRLQEQAMEIMMMIENEKEKKSSMTLTESSGTQVIRLKVAEENGYEGNGNGNGNDATGLDNFRTPNEPNQDTQVATVENAKGDGETIRSSTSTVVEPPTSPRSCRISFIEPCRIPKR